MVDSGPGGQPDHREGLEFEPHLRPRAASPEDADRLDEEPARASRVPENPDAADEHEREFDRSVADEPAVEWAGVDRTQVPGYREHLRRRVAATTPDRHFLTVLLAALAAGPFAVLGAFVEGFAEVGTGVYLAVIVFGPVAEEMMKVAAILWIVERKPWLLPGTSSIVLVGLAGGLGFAAIENVVYLEIYFPDPAAGLVRWRWTVCVAMHGGCSAIAALGIARMWRTAMRSGTPAQTSQAFPYLVTAMIIHGAYNALAVMMSMFGLTDA